MGLSKYIAKQLSSPKGFGGNIVSFFMNRQVRPMYEETICLLSLSGGEKVLDIGCGNGYVLNMIAKQYEGIFTGIDISESIIQKAAQRNRLFIKNGKMTFSCQDLGAMPFGDESFDRVYTINTVYFWDNLAHNMTEVNRVLKPGGIFVNTLFSNAALERLPHTKYGYRRFSEQELTEAGTKAGFSVNIVPIIKDTAFCYLYKKTDG